MTTSVVLLRRYYGCSERDTLSRQETFHVRAHDRYCFVVRLGKMAFDDTDHNGTTWREGETDAGRRHEVGETGSIVGALSRFAKLYVKSPASNSWHLIDPCRGRGKGAVNQGCFYLYSHQVCLFLHILHHVANLQVGDGERKQECRVFVTDMTRRRG